MTEYESLKQRLKETPYLVASIHGEVILADDAKVLHMMMVDGEHSLLIQNIGAALESFSRLKGVGQNDKQFTRTDLAKAMGVTTQAVWLYARDGILTPSIYRSRTIKEKSLYSWTDCFIAAILGTLRRHGLGQHVLRNVQPLLCEHPNPNKKRIGRKVSAPARS